MQEICVNGKSFRPFILAPQIRKAVKAVAAQMNADLEGKNVVLLCVLKGSCLFFSDLTRELSFDHFHSFVRLSSYQGTESTGEVRLSMDITDDITDKTVVIVEDIVDSGLTIDSLSKYILKKGAADVKVATFLLKPASLKYEVKLDYVALEIPSSFVLGYGLDYDQYGRNLKNLYILNEKHVEKQESI